MMIYAVYLPILLIFFCNLLPKLDYSGRNEWFKTFNLLTKDVFSS